MSSKEKIKKKNALRYETLPQDPTVNTEIQYNGD